MDNKTYKVVQIIGTSEESWEHAARNALQTASHSLRDLRVARVVEQDLKFENGKEPTFRTRMEVSFKYEGSS